MLTTPSTTDVAGHLRLVVARTARRLRQEAGADLSPSLTSALASIDRHGPLTPSELAAHERVQRPTATRLLARLAELGLVERAPAPPPASARPRPGRARRRPRRPPLGAHLHGAARPRAPAPPAHAQEPLPRP